MIRRTRNVVLSLLLAALAGCATGLPGVQKGLGTTKPGAAVVVSASPGLAPLTRAVPLTGQVVELTGKVKAISDNGAGGLAQTSNGIISNNSSGVIGNHGSGIISEHGAAIVGKTGALGPTFDLADVGQPREYLLADAVITVFDAKGAQLVDAKGKAITATSDATGFYTLKATLPAGNFVLHVKLQKGGELLAMLVNRGNKPIEQTIDTATSLGAAYVLTRFVAGDQSVYDRLGSVQSERLHLELLGARKLITKVPSYQTAELVSLTEGLRLQASPIDKALGDIKATLLGQANLGGGQLANAVPLAEPFGVTVDGAGNLYIAEFDVGRIRKVAKDGKLQTVLDSTFGRIKQNIGGIRGIVSAPDGTLYVASDVSNKIYKLGLDGQMTELAGTGSAEPGPLDRPASQVAVVPSSLALAPDGTVYVGEWPPKGKPAIPRVIVLSTDGNAHELKIANDWTTGIISALATDSDGTLYVGYLADSATGGGPARMYRVRPGSPATLVSSDFGPTRAGVIAIGTDGTIYSSNFEQGRVDALGPDGKKRIVVGTGGPTGLDLHLNPRGLAVGRDGTLFVSDGETNIVHALTTGGVWQTVAGTTLADSGDQGSLVINSPVALALDSAGGIIVAETSGNTLKSLTGHQFTTVAGTSKGNAGDGGPATAAKFDGPSAIAGHGRDLFVIDFNNNSLRKIGADGIVSTIVYDSFNSQASSATAPTRDAPTPANRWPVRGAALAVAPDGRVYWADTTKQQIYRLSADGKSVEFVAGGGSGSNGAASEAALGFSSGLAFDAAGDLYVADTTSMQIRKITGLASNAPQISTFAGLPFDQTLAVTKDSERNEEGIAARAAAIVGPGPLCFDASGNLYVGELGTKNLAHIVEVGGLNIPFQSLGFGESPTKIRKISKSGTITTIAGPGSLFFPDSTAADALSTPSGLVVDGAGRLVISDASANQIRILPAGEF